MTTARFATLDSHRAVAQKYAHSERQAAAVSQEAVGEARKGPVPGSAELDLHICYHAVVTTKSIFHLQEAAALSKIIYRELFRNVTSQGDAKVIGMALFTQTLEALHVFPGDSSCEFANEPHTAEDRGREVAAYIGRVHASADDAREEALEATEPLPLT